MTSCNSTNETSINLNVNYEISVSFTILSTISFFVAGGILIGYAVDFKRSFTTNHWNQIVLVIVSLLSIIEMLSYGSEHQAVNHISRIILEVVFGIICVIWGAIVFFSPNESLDGYLHQNYRLSTFIWVVTIVLVPFEIAFVAESFLSKRTLKSIVDVVGILQKLFQAAIYKYSLQFRRPKHGRQDGASWYFKLLALFNFVMWLNDIINRSYYNYHPNLESMFNKGYSIFSVTYSALIIEYRSLLTIFFAKHAISIDQHLYKQSIVSRETMEELKKCTVQQSDFSYESSVEISNSCNGHMQFPVRFTNEFSGFGNILGILLCTIQLVTAVQYEWNFGAWTNIIGILADLTNIICGFMLIRKLSKMQKQQQQQQQHEEEEQEYGLTLFIYAMGVMATTHWILQVVIAVTWTSRLKDTLSEMYNYLTWNSAQFVARTFSTLSQIHVFSCFSSKHVIKPEDNIRHDKAVHALIPFYMLSLLSIFLNSLIGTYTGKIENWIGCAELNIAFVGLHNIGAAFHLGFCLHLFVHFSLLNNDLKNSNKFFALHQQTGRRPTQTRCQEIAQENNDDDGDNDDGDNINVPLLPQPC